MTCLVVFGCSRGIGKSYVLSEATKYKRIYLFDYSDSVFDVQQACRELGVDCFAFLLDIKNDLQLKEVISGLPDMAVDHVVYFIRAKNIKDISSIQSNDWDDELDTTLKGAFFSIQALIPSLEKNVNSSVIFISSICAQNISSGTVSYHVAKAGLEHLCRHLAANLGYKGIRVNSVRLGFIVQEEHLERFYGNENTNYRALSERIHPLKRIGNVHDVIGAVSFLHSENASFITGHVLNVDGGLALREQSSLAFELAL